jgi:hypothetical protein
MCLRAHYAHRVAAGCEVKDFKAVAEAHSLDCQLDDSSKGRQSLRQAITSTKALSSIVGVTGEGGGTWGGGCLGGGIGERCWPDWG